MGEEERDSFNRSEYEAAVGYKYLYYVDDIHVVKIKDHDHTGSGARYNQDEEDDGVEGNEEEEGNESQEMASEPSFNFNDSLDVYLAKPCNESQIVTIESSEESVTMDGSWAEGANVNVAEDPNVAQVIMSDDEEVEEEDPDL